jgi:hypothetical protein
MKHPATPHHKTRERKEGRMRIKSRRGRGKKNKKNKKTF